MSSYQKEQYINALRSDIKKDSSIYSKLLKGDEFLIKNEIKPSYQRIRIFEYLIKNKIIIYYSLGNSCWFSRKQFQVGLNATTVIYRTPVPGFKLIIILCSGPYCISLGISFPVIQRLNASSTRGIIPGDGQF